MPKFKDEKFIQHLSSEIEQLRGRELPGFLSSQAFYLCMSQYVEMWSKPGHELIIEVGTIAQNVAGALADSLLSQYPNLCRELRTISSKILTDSIEDCKKKLNDLLVREKDPFTLNDFLQQWINKLRYDRFSDAVDISFEHTKASPIEWDDLKTEIFDKMKSWYKSTHSVSPMANAREMASILEAYWNLSSKRFVDSCCMMTDKQLLDKLASDIQQSMFLLFREDKKLQVIYRILVKTRST
jgi:interferon-induced GTP-binding protein Mx1